MDKQELKESVLMNLRSVTQSVKDGVPLARLERDYRDLLGSPIPYRDLGYNSLESFIRDIPGCIRVQQGRDGTLMAKAVADSSTLHIASLVSRQKQTTKKVPSKRSFYAPNRKTYAYRQNFRGSRTSYSQSNSTYHPPSERGHKHYPKSFTSSSYPDPKPQSYAPKANDYNPPTKPSESRAATTAPQARPPARSYTLAPRFQRLEEQKRKQADRTASSPEPEYQTRSIPSPTELSRQAQSPSPTNFSNEFAPPIRAPMPVSSTAPVRSRLGPISSSGPSVTTENGYSSGYAQRNPLRPLLSSNRQLELARSAKEYIDIYARMNNISVEYSNLAVGRNDKGGFVSNIKFNGKLKAQSYPVRADTAEEAEEIAAKKAVKVIKNEQAKLPVTPINTVEEIQILLSRIEELVCEKPSGMFTDGILHEYENKFKESLPEHWLDLLGQSSMLEVDTVDVQYGTVPDGANCIVRRAAGISSGSTTPSESSIKANNEVQDFEVEAASSKNNHADPNPLAPPLMIPDGHHWGVYITSVSEFVSDQYVSARLVDYDNDFLELSYKMSTFYETQIFPVQEVCKSQLYVTMGEMVNGLPVMSRVLATEIFEDDLVKCYHVDEGTFAVLKRSDLQQLDEEFLTLPYQAVHFAFHDLEEYEEFINTEHLQMVLNRTCIAVVKSRCRSFKENVFNKDPGVHNVIYSVELYDTSDPEDDIFLNDKIKNSVLKSLECRLPKLNASSQGYLTHITELGEIYLRFLPPDGSGLEALLERLSPAFEEECSKSTAVLPSGKICAAKFEDEKWYRAVILDDTYTSSSSDEVEVMFIDYGNPSKVQKSEICDLEPHSKLLSSLGSQAIKCELFNVLPTPDTKWTIAATEKLKEWAPFNKELILRVISEGNETTLPKVNLYVRMQRNNDSFIVTINENLALEPKLFVDKSTSSASVSTKVLQNLNLTFKKKTGSFSNYVPTESPVEVGLASSFNNMNITSPINDEIDWLPTPDNIKSPFEEEETGISLCLPQIPNEKEHFSVHVSIAASPDNFVVQPLDSLKDLKELRQDMTTFYTSQDNLIEMHPSMLKKSSFYAALHPDGAWYRVRLLTIHDSEPVTGTVYFVDYGDYDSVPLQNIQKLYRQFRSLSCQAIKAKLSGLRPIEGDWNPEHCIKFQEMIADQSFFSVIQHKSMTTEPDFITIELELMLVDTTDPDQDVYIHELLIEQMMALPKT